MSKPVEWTLGKCAIHQACVPRYRAEDGVTYVEHQIRPGDRYVITDRGPWTLEEIKSTFLAVDKVSQDAPEGPSLPLRAAQPPEDEEFSEEGS